MGILTADTEIPRKTLVVFFLIDTSGCMDGEKMDILNDTMHEILFDIKKISDENADALIKIAVLEFASGTEWITPTPQDVDAFRWQDLEAGGVADMGQACLELEKKLHRNAFLQNEAGNYVPIIILISGGNPTDDFKGGLEVLRQNKWFAVSTKIALAIGQDANVDVLAEFTGTKETVFPIMNKAEIKQIIRLASIRSFRMEE